jgi:hypothetical protein
LPTTSTETVLAITQTNEHAWLAGWWIIHIHIFALLPELLFFKRQQQ